LISEEICLAVLSSLHGRVTTYTETFNLDQPTGPTVKKSEVQNALAEGLLIRPLLAKYDLADVSAAIRWLELGDYVSKTKWWLGELWVHTLTEKGVTAVTSKSFGEDRQFLYQDLPYQVFLAHQFRDDDVDLKAHLVTTVLQPAGYSVVDGRADGMEQFRTAILSKIRVTRFVTG
jgi:hypothetical protein